MIPLKKIFPIIIALITISLFGIIYIQINWINSASHIKREQREQMLQQVTLNTASDLVNGLSFRMARIRVDTRIGTTDGGANRFNFETIEPHKPLLSIADVYDSRDVYEMIKRGLMEKKLDTVFEFGVVDDNGIRLFSPGFRELANKNVLEEESDVLPIIIGLNSNLIVPKPTLEVQNSFLQQNEMLWLIVPKENRDTLNSLTKMILVSCLFTVIIITAFALTIRTLFNQKKLSEIKSDFINNMTHELKTPLATISLAIDAIGNEKVMDNREKIKYFSGIIKEENKRMNKQVESILNSALLEKEALSLNLKPIDVHQLIRTTAENLQLQLDSKNGRIHLELNALEPVLMADEVHFSNLLFNLMDNAIKYSKEDLVIGLETYTTRKRFHIILTDNGIGMSRDTVSRIFEKFYRAHTGNVHNVKGFGLGLSYVKAVVDAHKGKIKVESVLGKGSKFSLEFPQE
jgi:two-component system phosphate regulon sensor histidine kinase PhoR